MTYSCYWLANAFALKQFFGISYQCLVTPRLSTSLSRDISTSLFRKVSTSLLARPENGPKSMCQASWDPLPLPEYLQRNRKTWFDSPVRKKKKSQVALRAYSSTELRFVCPSSSRESAFWRKKSSHVLSWFVRRRKSSRK